MTLTCDGCGRQLAKEDKRRRLAERLRLAEGVTLEQEAEGRATRLKCPCGRVLILLRGAT